MRPFASDVIACAVGLSLNCRAGGIVLSVIKYISGLGSQAAYTFIYYIFIYIILWRAGYAPADRQTSWGVLSPY
jgi:hypothetical protein